MVPRKDCWFPSLCIYVFAILGFLLLNKGVELFYLLGPSGLPNLLRPMILLRFAPETLISDLS